MASSAKRVHRSVSPRIPGAPGPVESGQGPRSQPAHARAITGCRQPAPEPGQTRGPRALAPVVDARHNPCMDEETNLRHSSHWKWAAWGVRVMGPGLAFVIVGLITLLWSTAIGTAILAVGILVCWVGSVLSFVEVHQAYGDVQPADPTTHGSGRRSCTTQRTPGRRSRIAPCNAGGSVRPAGPGSRPTGRHVSPQYDLKGSPDPPGHRATAIILLSVRSGAPWLCAPTASMST